MCSFYLLDQIAHSELGHMKAGYDRSNGSFGTRACEIFLGRSDCSF